MKNTKYYFNENYDGKTHSYEYNSLKAMQEDISSNGGKKNMPYSFITKEVNGETFVRCYNRNTKRYVWVQD